MTKLTKLFFSTRSFFIWQFLIALFMLASALFFQYVLGLEPCEICVFQRLVFNLILIFSLIGLIIQSLIIQRFAIFLIFTSFISSFLLGIYQSQIEQGNVISVCKLNGVFPNWIPLDNLIPWLYKPNAACSEANWNFLGYTMAEILSFVAVALALYSFIAFIVSFKKKNSDKNLYKLDL